MGNEALYLKAYQETEGNNLDEALWTKALVLSEGNEQKTRYRYVQMRVEQLEKDPNTSHNPGLDSIDVSNESSPEVSEPDHETRALPNSDCMPYIPADVYAKENNLPEEEVIRSIKNGKLMGRVLDDIWYVIGDNPSPTEEHFEFNKPVIERLMDGDFGLANTYWLWGVLASFIWAIPIVAFEESKAYAWSMGFTFLHFVYSVLVMVGTWNAASRYSGSQVWSVLAKISVVLGTLSMLIQIALIAKAI